MCARSGRLWEASEWLRRMRESNLQLDSGNLGLKKLPQLEQFGHSKFSLPKKRYFINSGERFEVKSHLYFAIISLHGVPSSMNRTKALQRCFGSCSSGSRP